MYFCQAMMTYIRVHWLHDSPTDPVWLYSELDPQRREVRKVELFPNGTYGYASRTERKGSTDLGLELIPTIDEIARDDQFKPEEITKEEFEDAWEKALILAK